MEYAFEELQFFEDHASSWTLYQNLREKLEVLCPETIIQVKNTQISLKNKYIYACVSFLPVHPKKQRNKAYITISFGLQKPVSSNRIDQITCPYPNRWTHHVLIDDVSQIDDQLLNWLHEAYLFAKMK